MAKDKIKEIGEVIWQWILLILLPSIALIIAIEFAKLIYALNKIWPLLILIIGLVAEYAEIKLLIDKTKRLFNS